MSERLQKLYSLPNAIYTQGSSIIVEAGNLLLDTRSGRVIVQLKLQNVSIQPVSAVKVLLTMFEANGTESETTEYQYLDLNVSQYQEFGQKTAIYLDGTTARSYAVCITEVVYADGKVWKSSANGSIQIPATTELRSFFNDDDLTEQYRAETHTAGSYLPEQISDLWRCTCGAVNCTEDKKCHSCGAEFDLLRSNLNKDVLCSKLAEHKAKVAEKKEVNKKRCLVGVAAIAVVAAISACVWITTNVIIPKMKYDAAVEQLENGSYEDAVTAFENLGDYKDSNAKLSEAERGLADQCYASGDYETAIQRYKAIGTDDAKEQIKACYYQMMLAAIEGKNWTDAEDYYAKADNYSDTAQFYDTIQMEKAKALVEEEKYEESYAILENYIDNEKYKDEILPLYNKCLYQIAMDEYEEKSFESAAEKFESLLTDATFGADAKEQIYLCAKAMYKNNDKDNAIKLFEGIKDYKDSTSFIPTKTDSILADNNQTSEVLSKLQGTWFRQLGGACDDEIIINGSSYRMTSYFYNLEGEYPNFNRISSDGTAVENGVIRISGKQITFLPTNNMYTRYYTDGSSGSAGAVNSVYTIVELTNSVLNLNGLVYNRK